jgi:hypothetical protein
MRRVVTAALAALFLALAGPALAYPEQIYTLLRPGGFVEVAVVDRSPVRAVALVAPNGQSLQPLQLRKDYVIPLFGPNGWYFDTVPGGPEYRYNPFRGEYGSDPRCNPEFGINRMFWKRGLAMPPLGCPQAIGAPPRDSRSRSVARFLVGDTAFFQQSVAQWRLRIGYADAAPIEVIVPPIAYGY